MCGIAGFYGDFDSDLTARMNATIAHRGPDDAGLWFSQDKRVGLAHRRLSIIDVSKWGHQPMSDSDGRAVIVYNGELYNYREFRSELEGRGVRFVGHSDTEVVLHAYLEYGQSVLKRFNGIFAFAIFDARDRSVLLVRDGLGVKPLYYSELPRGVLFASEIKALLCESSLDRELDPRALHAHLTYLWCPGPRTLLKRVRKVPPGSALLLRDGRIEKKWQYYELPFPEDGRYSDPVDPPSSLRTGLREAVHRQMVSDVPVGAFLSGGLDSSAIVRFARERAAGGRLDCFTIGLEGHGMRADGMSDDLPYAKRMAAHEGVNLNVVRVGPEMISHLPEVIYHLDEPQADPATINVLLIARLARDHGIKVLLSGSGGDDLFAGYRRHMALVAERYWSWAPPFARGLMTKITETLPKSNTLLRRIAKAAKFADRSSRERLYSYFYWIDPVQSAQLLTHDLRNSADSVTEPFHDAIAHLHPDLSSLDRMLFLEQKFFLGDHNLNYFDKLAMAAGVEVRVPFLDLEMTRFANMLSPKWKQRGHRGKFVLKRAMETELPKAIIDRPKTGFGAPLRYWLKNELFDSVNELLSVKSLRDRGIFDADNARAIIDADRAGRVDASYTVFAMLCIEIWCRIFLDKQTPAPAP